MLLSRNFRQLFEQEDFSLDDFIKLMHILTIIHREHCRVPYSMPRFTIEGERFEEVGIMFWSLSCLITHPFCILYCPGKIFVKVIMQYSVVLHLMLAYEISQYHTWWWLPAVISRTSLPFYTTPQMINGWLLISHYLNLTCVAIVAVSRGYDTCFGQRLVMGYADY